MPELFNRVTKQFEAATLVTPIEQQDVDCFAQHWRPLLDGKVQDLKAQDQYTAHALGNAWAQDAHWDWSEKLPERSGQLEWNSVALRCGGMTQGLMYLNLVQRCRSPGQEGQHLVYIDMVATAPWNRPTFGLPGYRGVGDVLMTEAILLSMGEGFDGRVGLHSLPQANAFYERWGMMSLGRSKGGLVYYELAAEKAHEHLDS